MPFDRTNTGILARNDRKQKETHPDFTGNINVNGVEYWLSGWIKTSGPSAKNPGSKFFSLAVKPKEGQSERPKTMAEQEPEKFLDDDIPF
jgi:hypothetical protein